MKKLALLGVVASLVLGTTVDAQVTSPVNTSLAIPQFVGFNGLGIGGAKPLDIRNAWAGQPINFWTTGNPGIQRMTILANGRVGIGTTTPGVNVDIQGDALSNTYLRVRNTGTLAGGIMLQGGGTGAQTVRIFSTGLNNMQGAGRLVICSDTNTHFMINVAGTPPTNPNFGFVSISNDILHPQSRLHLHDRYNTSVYSQFTNTITGNATANDGLRVGVNLNIPNYNPNTPFGEIRQEEDAPIRIMTDGDERMRIMGTTNQNTGGFPPVQALNANSGYVGIGATNPVSMLHIGDNAPTWWEAGVGGHVLGGYRNWMNTGTFYCHESDNMYVGLKRIGADIHHSIINWGNNPVGTLAADRLTFVFTAHPGINVVARHDDGLEIARMISNGNEGRMGIGGDNNPLVTPSVPYNPYSLGADPGNTVEINSPALNATAIGGSSGLRFTDLRDGISPPISPNPSQGVLSVDGNGDVIYVDAPTGVGFGAACINPTPGPFDLSADWRIGLHDNNLYFDGQDGPNYSMGISLFYTKNNVNIGYPCGIVYPYYMGKLSVLQTSPNWGYYIQANMPIYYSVAGNFVNLIQTTQTGWGSCYGVRSVAAGSVSSPWTNVNYGVYGEAQNGSVNYGIYGDVGSAGPTTPDFAGYFNGDIGTTAGFYEVSDTSLKENINTLKNASVLLSLITPCTFTFRTTPGMTLPSGKQYGFNAEEISSVFPELIKNCIFPEERDSAGNIITPEISYKSVNQMALIPVTIRAVQELDSAVTVLQQSIPPNKPILIAPDSGAVDVPLQVTLIWHKAERAEGYTVYISIPLEEAKSISVITQLAELEKRGAFTAINTTDTFAVITLPYYCKTYTWWVVAYNSAGSSSPSNEWNFTAVSPEVPASPVLASPANGAIDLPLANTFVWNSSERAEFYTLYIGTRPNYDPAGIVYTTGIKDTFTTANVPYCNTTYYWWVVANNCGGQSVESEKWTFITFFPQLTASALASPANGDTISGLMNPLFKWYKSEGASYYTLYISKTLDETSIVYNSTSVDTFLVVYASFEDTTTYYWWVKACNQCGCSEKSEIWSFFYQSGYMRKATEPLASDLIFKTNITPYTDALSETLQLQGKYFNWDLENFPDFADSTRQIGLIAQDVQPIIPEVVSTDAQGYSYIDYNRLVPVLVEAIKEMNTTNQQKDSIIGNLNDRLTQLEALVTQCCDAGSRIIPGDDNDNGNDNDKMNIHEIELASGKAIVLDQNVPNPFAENTTITYFIPDDVASAQIIFTDNTGRILKTIDINEKRKGMLKVYAQDLSSGIYSYTLIADGKTIDSKKMVKAGK